jgi:hypothetical protein
MSNAQQPEATNIAFAMQAIALANAAMSVAGATELAPRVGRRSIVRIMRIVRIVRIFAGNPRFAVLRRVVDLDFANFAWDGRGSSGRRGAELRTPGGFLRFSENVGWKWLVVFTLGDAAGLDAQRHRFGAVGSPGGWREDGGGHFANFACAGCKVRWTGWTGRFWIGGEGGTLRALRVSDVRSWGGMVVFGNVGHRLGTSGEVRYARSGRKPWVPKGLPPGWMSFPGVSV